MSFWWEGLTVSLTAAELSLLLAPAAAPPDAAVTDLSLLLPAAATPPASATLPIAAMDLASIVHPHLLRVVLKCNWGNSSSSNSDGVEDPSSQCVRFCLIQDGDDYCNFDDDAISTEAREFDGTNVPSTQITPYQHIKRLLRLPPSNT